MANICLTDYRLLAESNADAKRFVDDFNKVKEVHKQDTYSLWLGHLAIDLLGYTEEQINNGKIYVRGEIHLEDYSEDCKDVILTTETAWTPCYRLMRELAEKYNLECYWLADERGCAGIWSNDAEGKIWDHKYTVCINGEDLWHNCEEDAIRDINTYLVDDKNERPINCIADLDDDNPIYDDIYVYEIEYSTEFEDE